MRTVRVKRTESEWRKLAKPKRRGERPDYACRVNEGGCVGCTHRLDRFRYRGLVFRVVGLGDVKTPSGRTIWVGGIGGGRADSLIGTLDRWIDGK